MCLDHPIYQVGVITGQDPSEELLQGVNKIVPAEHLAQILALPVCTSSKSGVSLCEGMFGEEQQPNPPRR